MLGAHFGCCWTGADQAWGLLCRLVALSFIRLYLVILSQISCGDKRDFRGLETVFEACGLFGFVRLTFTVFILVDFWIEVWQNEGVGCLRGNDIVIYWKRK